MLSELRSEREQIEQAILTLERLAIGHGKRRGRPPKWLSTPSGPPQPRPGKKRVVNPETRARMAAAQRKRWAAKKTKSNSL